MRGILATHVVFSHCYPPLIYYLTERSLFKKCPPHGKILKKGPEIISLIKGRLLHIINQEMKFLLFCYLKYTKMLDRMVNFIITIFCLYSRKNCDTKYQQAVLARVFLLHNISLYTRL
jgi:hypothetical protein